MKILYVGDVLGKSGRQVVVDHVPVLRKRLGLDFVIACGENAAAGFGITEKICQSFFEAGVDVITTGNHVWDQRELLDYIQRDSRVLRPANLPPEQPGRGSHIYKTKAGQKILVAQVMGRVFMDPTDDPFRSVNEALSLFRLGKDVSAVVVDIHAEATSEKMAMGQYLDGRASLVVGTHSHIPTADAQILTGGTAYQTDAGMCGDYDSVIGMRKEQPIIRFTTKLPSGRFQPAEGPGTLCAVFVETDDDTGLAKRIEPVRIGGRLKETVPSV